MSAPARSVVVLSAESRWTASAWRSAPSRAGLRSSLGSGLLPEIVAPKAAANCMVVHHVDETPQGWVVREPVFLGQPGARVRVDVVELTRQTDGLEVAVNQTLGSPRRARYRVGTLRAGTAVVLELNWRQTQSMSGGRTWYVDHVVAVAELEQSCRPLSAGELLQPLAVTRVELREILR